jgi:prepilin-type N-terminal cleavage/methylation domain-containing protein
VERTRGAGFTLYELAVVVAVMGIALAMAVPRLERMAALARTRGAANRLAADLAYTRHLATRTGCSARLVLERAPGCPAPAGWTAGHRYRILRCGADSVVARRDLRVDGAPLCVAANGPVAVTFRSNGVVAGFNNRTMVVRQGTHPADTLTLSSVGRVRRRY